jgi:hypothetical protein
MFINHFITKRCILIHIMTDASVKIGETLVNAANVHGSMIYLGTFFFLFKSLYRYLCEYRVLISNGSCLHITQILKTILTLQQKNK